MHSAFRAITRAAVLIAAICGASQAWALTGGGTAPGGPLSGSVRPACNGYNMDGTVNASPGAGQPGCVDHSLRAIEKAYRDRRAPD